ncbi:MAG TPA: tetratricopeptide repeat protein [Gemmatales bacterium]|nr:tetratricopeptide repeat protein [Gemmatales bacterium]
MAIDPVRVKELFLAAVAVTDPAARAAFLDRECAEDQACRARVEALLRADEAGPSSAGEEYDKTATGAPRGPRPATTVLNPDGKTDLGLVLGGKYRLIEPLGEGGMGQVLLAQQTEPVKRAVAVKVIKAGMDSRAVLARFDAERQALAIMDHPHIAKVFDAGTTPGGEPFFVMELVRGTAITQFCDDRRLTPRQRLELFVPVCQAIQHAHQKGVIHRDIKPSNVLVALYDDRPVPKVIDFGVAKATGQTLTEQTLVTGLGTVVGTLEYMSPEQASLNQVDVDTRSDVYSLGVLLYELLTGSTPMDRKRLHRAAIFEMLRIVREVEAPRASERLSTSDTLPSVAANRGIEPAELSRLLRGELDWVLLKALEKDRTRRYETANGLARDIQRFLADEVVEARPPSTAYRLQKLIRRHKGKVLAAGLILATLLAGIVGTTWGLLEANRARAAESERATGERLAKEQAERERDEKEQQRRFAQAIADFLKDDLLALTSVEGQDRFGDPKVDLLGKDATVRQLLDRAAAKLDQRHDLAPNIEAELRWMIGVNYRALGQYSPAIAHLERAMDLARKTFGRDHPETLHAQNSLAMAYSAAGRYADAQRLFEENLRQTRTACGPDHPDTLNSMSNLARAYQVAGHLDRALPLHVETLKLSQAKLGADHPDTILYMGSLAQCYRSVGKLDLALPLLEQAAALAMAQFGADRPQTLWCQEALANGYRDAGRLDRAVPLLEEVCKGYSAKFGSEHPLTLRSMDSLAGAYVSSGKRNQAVPLYEEALRLSREKLGPDHPETLTFMNNLAECYRIGGQWDRALPLLEEALKRQRATLGPDHPDTLTSMNNLALSYQAAGQIEQAVPLFEETLRQQKAKQGPDHRNTLTCMNNLGMAYQAAGKAEQALQLFREAATGGERLGFQHPYASRFVGNLIGSYERLGQLDQAEVWRRKWLAVVEKQSGAASLPYASNLVALGVNLLQQEKWSAAEPILRAGLKIRAQAEPEAWSTFHTMSFLGAAILGRARGLPEGEERTQSLAEAESLLVQGYEGMRQREQTISPQVKDPWHPAAIDRLIDLYTVLGQPEAVKKWQQERAQFPPPKE